jgi:hypothetical protein
MIDWTHSTEAEREVIASALAAYQSQLAERLRESSTKREFDDATWRIYITERIYASLRGW